MAAAIPEGGGFRRYTLAMATPAAEPIPAVLADAIEAVARETLGPVRPLRVLLFGSRAAGTARRYSDYDIALASDRPISASLLLEAKARLDELPIFQRIDLVDLSDASGDLRAAVETSGIVLYERP